MRGALVFLFMIGMAAIYLMIAAPMLGAFSESPLIQDPSVSDSDAMIDFSGPFERIKDVGLIGVPLIMMGGGLLFAVVYYIRRETAGGVRRRPRP